MDNNEIREYLLSNADEAYRAFTLRLSDTLEPSRVLGVRMGKINALAAGLLRDGSARGFMKALPHGFHEEDMLHAAVLRSAKMPFEELVTLVEEFLPFVADWSVCDTLPPRAFAGAQKALRPYVLRFLGSRQTYTVRFALVLMIKFYLRDETFDVELLQSASRIKSDEYYVNMALAWYLSAALTHQYESALPIIEGNALEKRVRNKTIQKAVESFCISDERKAYLRSLRR